MNINVVIAIIFIIIIAIIAMIIDDTKKIIIIWILCVIGYVLCIYNDISNIPAIEVYRGNSELKTDNPWYIEDTLVIWKNK